jgi:hypothetical protein
MKTRTVTISDADARELAWLRGGLHALMMCIRCLDRALEHGDLKFEIGMHDFAGILNLVDAIEDCDVLDNLIDGQGDR